MWGTGATRGDGQGDRGFAFAAGMIEAPGSRTTRETAEAGEISAMRSPRLVGHARRGRRDPGGRSTDPGAGKSSRTRELPTKGAETEDGDPGLSAAQPVRDEGSAVVRGHTDFRCCSAQSHMGLPRRRPGKTPPPRPALLRREDAAVRKRAARERPPPAAAAPLHWRAAATGFGLRERGQGWQHSFAAARGSGSIASFAVSTAAASPRSGGRATPSRVAPWR